MVDIMQAQQVKVLSLSAAIFVKEQMEKQELDGMRVCCWLDGFSVKLAVEDARVVTGDA